MEWRWTADTVHDATFTAIYMSASTCKHDARAAPSEDTLHWVTEATEEVILIPRREEIERIHFHVLILVNFSIYFKKN